MSWTIYVIECEGGKYYIDRTENLGEGTRISLYTPWTYSKLYPPTGLTILEEKSDIKLEDENVLKYMEFLMLKEVHIVMI